MKNRLSRYYCQYNGIVVGFGIVFAFLFGVRTYSFWQHWFPDGFALLVTLITATLFSYVTHQLLTRLSLRLFRSVTAPSSSCSL